MFLEVAFPLPLNRTFHYRPPAESDGTNHWIGRRVYAPFGKKALTGFVIGTQNETPNFPTKPVHHWIDSEPLMDEKLLELARWVSDRYLCSLGEALASVVPPALAAPKREPQAGRADAEQTPIPKHEPLVLTAEQKKAVEPLLQAADAGQFKPFLLRGITDSGKTEVYLRVMDQVIEQGKQALFLLPEIALTPPFLDKLRARYGAEHVGLWHSGLAGGERYRTWKGARTGELKVLLGARSAVFAPFPNLGLIILDEEHEAAYKQEERPRYHTREVALKRAELSKAVLVMGSATPSLETYWNATHGQYTLLELTSRVEARTLPPVELIDLRKPAEPNDKKEEGKPARRAPRARFSVFSEPLKFAIEQRLARREQVLLFVSRRGFTPFLRCSLCGWVARCSRCSTTTTMHLGAKEGEADRYMQCHACGLRSPIPEKCPQCKSRRLHQYGVGTQKVEEELKRLFPFVKAGRLDRDIASQRKQYEKIYRAFVGKELDVLIGTQMIAKGFDFPNVTLVGVVEADVSLHLPDFRSAERTFDLLTQVAGRTGRGAAKGKVLVQTQHPDHYALQAAKNHDYLGFYEKELPDRERLQYPPFCRLVNLVFRATKEPAAHHAAEDMYSRLEKLESGAQLLGPAPAPYSRVRNQFRYQILLKGTDATLHPCLTYLRGARASKAYMNVDVDPADLL